MKLAHAAAIPSIAAQISDNLLAPAAKFRPRSQTARRFPGSYRRRGAHESMASTLPWSRRWLPPSRISRSMPPIQGRSSSADDRGHLPSFQPPLHCPPIPNRTTLLLIVAVKGVSVTRSWVDPMLNSKIELLQLVPLFAGLSADELEAIANAGEKRYFEAGEEPDYAGRERRHRLLHPDRQGQLHQNREGQDP